MGIPLETLGRGFSGSDIKIFQPYSILWPIDKVYIDGPCGIKTLAGVSLARFERVSHVSHFYK